MENNVGRFLWKYLRRLRLVVFFIILSLTMEAICYRLSFYYISQIVDWLSTQLPKKEILHKAFILILLASAATVVRSLVMNGYMFFEARFLPLYRSILSKDLFKYAHKHSTSFFDEEMAGNVSGKIRNIIDASISLYYSTVWGCLQFIIAFIVTFFFLFDTNIIMALIMFLLMSLSVCVLFALSKVIAPYAKESAKTMSEANGILVDSITNSALVKGFSNYNFERKNYYKALKKAALAARKEGNKFGQVFFIQSFLRYSFEIAFFAIPLYFWYIDKITVGDFVFVQTLVFGISGRYNHVMMTFSETFRRAGQIKDGLEMLSRPYDIEDIAGAKKLNKKTGDVIFHDVYYHYKTATPLFENFSLEIKKGEKIGLVGHSGAGKSTLIKILSRNYDIQGGTINIGKQNIKEVTQDSLREAISLIPQDPSLFNRTIMENIRYGKLKATDKEVFAAAKKAFCHEFIISLPKGYESKVGDRGVMLSGGERQRIAIARAILKNAPILILDEATSALDSKSEKYIHESLKNLMKDKTVIAVAHRLSTLREMDRIVVLEKGRIIEEGSHKSLLHKKGVYYAFYEMQSQGFLALS